MSSTAAQRKAAERARHIAKGEKLMWVPEHLVRQVRHATMNDAERLVEHVKTFTGPITTAETLWYETAKYALPEDLQHQFAMQYAKIRKFKR